MKTESLGGVVRIRVPPPRLVIALPNGPRLYQNRVGH